MPELPEVETVCRGLAPVVTGQTIGRVIQRRPDLRIPLPDHFATRLEGRRILAVRRRAKYIQLELESGDLLIIHLGMSGRIEILPPSNRQGDVFGKHDHVVIDLANGVRILYRDPRRFGLMTLIGSQEAEDHPLFRDLGPEPLGNTFSSEGLSRALAGRRSPIKAALLDQTVVAGLGNIYVCEALYRAGISPKRQAYTVAGKRAERLTATIRDVLRDAIAAGGSSLRDYAHVDGQLGYFQFGFSVYDREGETCRRDGCGGIIRRIVQSNRSTFYCPACQR